MTIYNYSDFMDLGRGFGLTGILNSGELGFVDMIKDNILSEVEFDALYSKKINAESNPEFVLEKNHLESVVKALNAEISKLSETKSKIISETFTYYDDIRNINRRDKLIWLLKKIAMYNNILTVPYKLRMDLLTDNKECEVLYLGLHHFEVDGYAVYNWQTELLKFYQGTEVNFELDKTRYTVKLKRAFAIENSQFINYYDKFILGRDEVPEGLTDPFLISLLLEKKSIHRLSDIIRSIQNNQWKIIEYDINKSFVVQGCAASGKTMILLHRLSYIKYNTSRFNYNTVKIVTPHKLFNVHINGLVIDLELDNVDIFDISSYYLFLLKKYEDSFYGWKWSIDYVKQYSSINILSDDDNEAYLDYIYSMEFKSLCVLAVETYFADIKESSVIFELEEICKQHKFNVSPLSLTSAERYIGDNLREYAKQIIVVNDGLKKEHDGQYSLKQKETRDSQINAKFISQDISKYEKEFRAVEKDMKKADKENNRDLSDSLETKCIELMLKIDELKEKYSLAESAYEKKKRKLKTYESRINVLNSEELAIINKVHRSLEPRAVFDNTINRLLEEKSKLFKVNFTNANKSKDFSKYHLYLHLLFWTCFKGRLDDKDSDKYLHIDEGQDLSVTEYEVLSIVNKGAIFNIYGDTSQLIMPNRGIDDWGNLQSVISTNEVFTLNENYRNTVEVTEYCNKWLGYDMLAIGTDGVALRHISMLELMSEVKELPNDGRRIAVIAKNSEILDLLPQDLDREISYLIVKSAKGLEFDMVYVIDKGLSENEKYVAYTRSLNDLIIVRD